MPQDGDKRRLSSVANAVRLIKAFTDDDFELGISALAGRLGLAKSTVHRLATTLVEGGLLEQSPATGRYRLGLPVFAMGAMVRRKLDVYAEAKPWLLALREQSGETIRLAVWSPTGPMFINLLDSPQPLRTATRIGQRLPIHCAAEGKALLAYQDGDLVERLLQARLAAATGHSLTDPILLRETLAVVRARGYALEDEEWEPGVRAIAAPIRDDNGRAVAAIGIAGPVQRLTRPALLAMAPGLTEVAHAVSRRLGERIRAAGAAHKPG